MKKAGAFFEYEDARNSDLMRAYREELRLHQGEPLMVVFRAAVNRPSQRFWVSEERAAIVVSAMTRGVKLEKMGANKREMYQEIYNRVMEARKRNPEESIYNLTFDIVNGPAPKFYLTPSSAKVIVHKIKKQWYEERKRKYRHLFM